MSWWQETSSSIAALVRPPFIEAATCFGSPTLSSDSHPRMCRLTALSGGSLPAAWSCDPANPGLRQLWPVIGQVDAAVGYLHRHATALSSFTLLTPRWAKGAVSDHH